MTGGCPTHAHLVGGYVLGALEPDETAEMERHAAWCPQCGPEVRRLGGLPALLERIEPGDVPPPALAPRVEDAVLDRFARERAHPAAAAEPRRRRRWRRLAALVPAGAALLGLAIGLAWPFGGDDGDGDRAYASASLAPLPAAASGAQARADVAEVPAGTRVRLTARGLGDRAMYELWCVRADGRWVSGGTFRADPDGSTEAYLTAAVRPGDYHVMVVTRRRPDAAENSRGTAVLRGRLAY